MLKEQQRKEQELKKEQKRKQELLEQQRLSEQAPKQKNEKQNRRFHFNKDIKKTIQQQKTNGNKQMIGYISIKKALYCNLRKEQKRCEKPQNQKQ